MRWFRNLNESSLFGLDRFEVIAIAVWFAFSFTAVFAVLFI